jgi:hypothetical protein
MRPGGAARLDPSMKALISIVLFAACGGPAATDPGIDGNGAGSGNGSGSGSGASEPLFPLGTGDRWTYAVTAVGGGSICAPGMHEQHVVSANAVAGRPAFQLTSFCTGIAATYDYAPGSNDEVDFYYQGTWLVLVDPTLTEGHAWPYFNTSYHWHREASVTVPAGTYHDCWTAVQDVSYTAYLTYCRGAGLVRSYSSDLTGSGWDAQLASATIE